MIRGTGKWVMLLKNENERLSAFMFAFVKTAQTSSPALTGVEKITSLPGSAPPAPA